MTPATKRFILGQLKAHRNMSLATVRSDGYPQATTVAYANDGLTLYFACDRNSQKVRNLRRSSRRKAIELRPTFVKDAGQERAAH